MSIAKRESLSNNCAQDLVTGLMWSRYGSFSNAKMGAASNGLIPVTGQLYDIYQWCTAANAASLGGYTDWRIPNMFELVGLLDMEAPNPRPDTAVFPDIPANYVWTSTSRPDSTTSGAAVSFATGFVSLAAKTTAYYAMLVRGGVA